MNAKPFDDAPFDLPAPATVAEACMARAWDDDCDDASRLLLEQAALTITHLCGRCVDLAAVIEHGDVRRAGR
jgi:hypothetical protein